MKKPVRRYEFVLDGNADSLFAISTLLLKLANELRYASDLDENGKRTIYVDDGSAAELLIESNPTVTTDVYRTALDAYVDAHELKPD